MKKKLLTAALVSALAVSLLHSAQTISIREAANFGLCDNGIANDGKGGFSDDAVNLENIKYKDGVNKVFGEDFDLIDPAKNDNKAVLAFECKKSKTGLREVVLDLSGKKIRGESLNLLHTSTKSPDIRYTKIGKILINYADGSKNEFEIDYAIDVMNGLHPQERSNAKIWSPSKSFAPAYFFSRFKIAPKEIKSIKLSTMDIATWVVAGISVSEKYPSWKASANEWVESDISEIAVKEGSVLDVSKDFNDDPSGAFGRVIVSKKGKFAFEKRQNAKLKFHGTVWYMAGETGKTVEETKRNLSELCKIAKRQGYNLLRFHTTDYICSTDPQKVLEGFDLYDWLIAQAQKNGIYLNLLIGNNIFKNNDDWDDRFSTKIKMIMGDPQTREKWKTHAKNQLEHINPYTGLAWKDDPTFMGMEFWNEMDLFTSYSRLSPQAVAFTNSEFVKFLKSKYADVDELNKSGKLLNKKYKSFDEIDFRKERTSSEFANLLQAKNREFRDFCENVVKNEIGYKGLIYQYNCNRTVNLAYMSAEIADYMALNIYYTHPSAFMSIGSTVSMKSSLDSFAEHMRAGMTHKVSNRPICLTEYNHCHWNPFKHEGGIVFGAYAALQDFDGMVAHSDAVKTGAKINNFLGSFGINNSPVMRANEFLTYCMFVRGDVKKSKNKIELFFPKDYIENSNFMMHGVNDEQSKLSLICGFSTSFEGAKTPKALKRVKTKSPNLRIQPVGASEAHTAQNFASTGTNVGDIFNLEAFVNKMREDGIIPADNMTTPSQGVFQSDTGEIVMDAKNSKISVITPRTEAIAFKKGRENLASLNSVESTTPCSVGVCSMDKNPLAESKSIVLVYATDNINADMRLSENRQALLKNANSKSKVLLKRGKLSAKLKVAPDTNFKLFALKYNGERIAEIPSSIKDGMLKIEIDNSKYPTTFFEIAAQ